AHYTCTCTCTGDGPGCPGCFTRPAQPGRIQPRGADAHRPCQGTARGSVMDRPIIVCGLGRLGTHVLAYLLKAGLSVAVIDTLCKPDDPRLGSAKLISGDCRRREVLQEAGLATARGVLIVTADDLLNV